MTLSRSIGSGGRSRGRKVHLFHPLLNALDGGGIEGSLLRRGLAGTFVASFVTAFAACLLMVFEHRRAFVACPAHVDSNIPMVAYCQGECLLFVAWVASGILFGLGPGYC